MANTTTDWSKIEDLIQSAEAGDGVVGVTIVAPDGSRFEHNGDRRFRAASTMKIPLMVAIYRQIEQGSRSLSDLHVLYPDEKAVGSGVLLHLHDGSNLTLNDLVYLMISISDNTATNMLIDLATMPYVNEVMGSLGMANSTLGRKMQGKPAEGSQQENWATPNDYVTAVQALLANQAAGEDACQKMIAMLEKQQSTHRISRYLPEGDDIRWGSKTGSINGVTNDVGFISTSKGTLVLGVFCENLPDQHVGEQFIGNVSRAAMRATGVAEPLETS